MTYNKMIPYNSLPLIPPKVQVETVEVLKKAIAANKALAELRGWSYTQSNPLLLLQSIALQEAKASSEIENVVTTNDELYQALSSQNTLNITPAAKEVMHYKEALWYGYNKIKEEMPLTINLFVELFRIVKVRSDGIRKLPGTCLKNTSNEIVYTPPDNEEDILRLLSNFEKYINIDAENDLDPLIKLALIHYQFECIHPFPDGNGRVGRIINVLYLVQKQLLNFPILYLSRYIIENKSEYYEALKGVTENQDWGRWILYILDSVEQTSKNTLNKIKQIYTEKEMMCKIVKEKLPKIYSKELIELLFEQPYCKIDFLVNRNIAKPQTASKYLKSLQELGALDVQKVGREKYYINTTLWNILTK
jgi:Fic family protein